MSKLSELRDEAARLEADLAEKLHELQAATEAEEDVAGGAISRELRWLRREAFALYHRAATFLRAHVFGVRAGTEDVTQPGAKS